MQPEVQNLEIVEEPEITEQDIVSYLIGIGVNACRRGYDSDQKTMYSAYMELPLSSIVDSWEHFDQNVKLNIIESHIDSFSHWIKEKADG